jgi:PAS domain S-box-containing protein
MKKKLHEMLSAESITTLINNINDAVFIHSEDGKIIYVNEKALQLYGMAREDVGKLSIVNDLSGPGAPVENVREIWNKVLSNETESTVVEWVPVCNPLHNRSPSGRQPLTAYHITSYQRARRSGDPEATSIYISLDNRSAQRIGIH